MGENGSPSSHSATSARENPRASSGAIGDRRHHSARAADRRRAAEDALLDALLLPTEGARESVGSEGQTLLMKGLVRLVRQEGVGAAVAWANSPDGGPRVLGAQPADASTRVRPSPEFFDALASLERVTRLTEGHLSVPLKALAAQGVSAVAPVGGRSGRGGVASAVLLVFPEKTIDQKTRPLRPRTVAVLGEVAMKLSHSISTNLAVERLGQLDGAVQRLDRLAALGGLVTEIVHEVRNPLVSVKTFLQLLPDRLDDPEFHGDFRGLVGEEVRRLERMLDDLLRHARPRSTADDGDGGRISDAAETTLQLLTYRCRERGIELETEIRPELPALALSDDALRQLLLNLMLNASQVTPTGGRIRLVADWSQETANHLELRVEDDGPGLDPGVGERLFEPFWTSRPEGAGGLGLAICKRIAEDSGGRISAENRKQGGACVRVELPIAY